MDPKRLESVPLFASLSKRERRELARHADELDLDPGRRLVNEGDVAYEFFVIEEGTAEVTRGDQHVADLGPGDYFGEMGAIGVARRNASVVTTSPMRAIVMTAREFRQMAREMPTMSARIHETVEARCRQILGADAVPG